MNPHDLQAAVARASPPVMYVSVSLLGVSLPDWVAIATLIYILLQAAHLVWRWNRSVRNSGADDQ